MELFYLEEPTIERKDDALEFLDEFVRYESEINGTECLDKCLEGWTYEEFLIENEKRKGSNYAYSINRCPSKTFFFVRQNDNKIVGMISVRYDITDEFITLGASHIGYSIRPTERRKGYNKIQLYLGLLEERKLGENRLVMECTEENIGSNKSILALGGVLEKTELDEKDNMMSNYYFIDVEKSIEEFSNLYEKYIRK